MAGVYSTRLILGEAVGETALEFVVPGTQVAIVTDLDGVMDASAGNFVGMATQDVPFVVTRGVDSIDGYQQVTWRGRVVLNSGDTLVVNSPTGANVQVSGYLLNSP